MARITIDQWLFQAMADTNLDGPCTGFSLVHKVGAASDEIYAIKLGTGKWDAKEMATIFIGKAQAAVQDKLGRQEFTILAFYANRPEPQSKMSFVQENGDGTGFETTHAPTKEGALGQAMNMAQHGFTFFHQQSVVMYRMALEAAQSTAKQNQELMAENREAIQLVKTIVMDRAAQDHAFRMAEIEAKKSAETREFLMKLGPVVVNAVTGKEVFPQSTADTALIESIIDNLSESDIQAFAQKLPPALMGPLAARATEYLKKKQAAQAEASRALVGRTDPVTDDKAAE